jgi:hypothetical protein
VLTKYSAYFDECHPAQSISPRPLGLIALEMMEQGSPPDTEGKLVLRHPKQWSPEASNFLYITNWGTLKDIEEVRKIYYSWRTFF